MIREKYDKILIKWVKNHYWDSLEKDKDLILRHLRTFVGDGVIFNMQSHSCKCNPCTPSKPNRICRVCGGTLKS